MIQKIFQKEFRVLIASARFKWSTLIFLLLLAAGLSNGIHYYIVESGRRNAAADATYRQWLNQGEKNPHSAAHYGFYAYKPVPHLAILDKGLDDYLGNAIWLEAHYQNETKARSITDKLSLSRFGDLTTGLLLTMIVPLLIIILGYNIVSAEKENNTLRMLLSTKVSTKQVLWGKAMALFSVSVLWLLTAIIVLFITLAVVRHQPAVSNTSHLFIILLALLVLQLAISLGVTALSAWCKHSATALVTGIACWMAAAILIPRLSGTVAELAHPIPTAFSFQQAVDYDRKHGLDGHNTGDNHGKKFVEEVLKKYKVDSLSQLPVNFAGLALQAGEEEGNKIFDKHFTALHTTLRNQDRTMHTLSLLSPLLAGRNLVHGLSETDLNHHTLFIYQAEQHRRSIQKLMNEDYAMGGAGKTTYLRGKELWQQVRNFQFQQAGPATMLQQQILNVLVLAGWLLISVALVLLAAGQLKFLA